MSIHHARSPFIVSAGVDPFLAEPAINLGCGPQRWSLTAPQARELARSLMHAVRHVEHAPRLSIGSDA